LPFSQEDYNANVDDPINFRKCIDDRIELFPELLPPEIAKGYMMKDIYYSKKQSVPNRRIESEDLSSGAKKNNIPSVIANPIKKLRQNFFPFTFSSPRFEMPIYTMDSLASMDNIQRTIRRLKIGALRAKSWKEIKEKQMRYLL
jgi:hypothetical protein